MSFGDMLSAGLKQTRRRVLRTSRSHLGGPRRAASDPSTRSQHRLNVSSIRLHFSRTDFIYTARICSTRFRVRRDNFDFRPTFTSTLTLVVPTCLLASKDSNTHDLLSLNIAFVNDDFRPCQSINQSNTLRRNASWIMVTS